jgi:hypothetical protein
MLVKLRMRVAAVGTNGCTDPKVVLYSLGEAILKFSKERYQNQVRAIVLAENNLPVVL